MLSSNRKFSFDVGTAQIVLIVFHDLVTVSVVHRRVLRAVEDIDTVTSHVCCRIDGAGLSVIVGPRNERWNRC